MDNSRLERQSDEARNTIDDLVSEIERLETLNETLSVEIVSLQETVNDLENEIEHLKDHIN